jgi:ribosomal protection tetracycline resistance protein
LLRRTLNLGILAHVDAGKTTLTERLLYAAGVIDEIGSVDDGSTQTDTLALERQRGITIKSAVVSFPIDGVTVNLIDTPGHPDFIAEVERVLSVLDGAVLVISAVEGVQSQTPLLMRALQRLHVPTLLFVNKVDRRGADCDRVTQAIAERLTPWIVPMGLARDAAFRARLAEVLAERDEVILNAYVDDESVSYDRLRKEFAAQTKRGVVHPVFCGSAMTGAGLGALMTGIAELLPAAEGDAEGPASGTVFKIERGPAGERIAYVRMFSGALRVRDRLQVGEDERKVTAIKVFDGGGAVQRDSVTAREIGKVWGLGEIKIGDAIGEPRAHVEPHFAPPTLETVVVPVELEQKGALYAALTQLAEQDPLIDLRQDDVRQELFLSLYGEVQKEVIQETLATDFGIGVDFRETTTICAERPIGTGAAVEILGERPNPFHATVGLRVRRDALGSGVTFRLEVELGSMPLAFFRAVEDTVRETLRQGLCGWQVLDCEVTMTHSGYSAPSSTAGDFRLLTPLVLMSALAVAGTVVCEPIHHFRLEIPVDAIGPVLSALARLDAVPETPSMSGTSCAIEGDIAAARVHELRLELPALTRGEGVLECEFGRYEPVNGTIPSRPRSDGNPLNREEYLLRASGAGSRVRF